MFLAPKLRRARVDARRDGAAALAVRRVAAARGRGEPEAGARLVRRRAGRARVAEARDVRFVGGQRRDSQRAGPGGVLLRHLRPRQV